MTTTFVAPPCLRTFCRASWTIRSTTVWVGSSSPSGGPRARRDVEAGQRPLRRHRVEDRAVQPELGEDRRPQLGQEAAHVAQSRRSSSRRNRSSVWAIRGSDSKIRSMKSTWKIALDSACAGPSWTSCASRGSLGLLRLEDPHLEVRGATGSDGSLTSVASSRSRNSQVCSRLRIASSRRDSSPSWRPRPPRPRVDLVPHGRRRRSAAPASAPSRRRAAGGRRRRRPPGAVALQGAQVVRTARSSAPGRRDTPRGTGRAPRAGCCRRTRAPRSPRRAARRTGCRWARCE